MRYGPDPDTVQVQPAPVAVTGPTKFAAWEQRRNAEKAQINWMFTTKKARVKLRKAYPVKES
jgi:hypothetical protein